MDAEQIEEGTINSIGVPELYIRDLSNCSNIIEIVKNGKSLVKINESMIRIMNENGEEVKILQDVPSDYEKSDKMNFVDMYT